MQIASGPISIAGAAASLAPPPKRLVRSGYRDAWLSNTVTERRGYSMKPDL
jgi:hypothetical protein